MKLNFQGERVLAVVAHPDDAELTCAGTLARAKVDKAEIGICVMCRGDKGQPAKKIANLSRVRAGEMAAAAKLLGATLYTVGNPDGELVDNNETRSKLTEVYRRFNPTLVLAHDMEDYHPDHRAAGTLAEAASWFCASQGYVTKSAAMKTSPAVWWMDTINLSGFSPEFFVDISDHTEIKVKMLACHKSQLQRGTDADFSPLAELMRQDKTRGSQSGTEAAEAFRANNIFKRARAW